MRQALVFSLASLSMLRRRFDVLEVDAIPFLPLFPMRFVSLVRRRPMVTTWHEYWGRSYWVGYLGVRGNLAAMVERVGMSLPTRIVAASEGTGDRLRGASRRPPDVVVIPNGVATRNVVGVASDLVTKGDAQSSVPRLISVGRLLDHKRVDLAIQATHLLHERGVAIRLTVIGEGPERDRLMALTDSLDLRDSVSFSPFLENHDDVLAALRAADLLVFPSVREGFGMVALEAMAQGTPVVTSDHPDNFARHLVRSGENGQVAPAEADAMAAAIMQALRDGERLRDGALRTAAQYDWDHLADLAAAAYAMS